MTQTKQASLPRHVRTLQRQFAQQPGLPFADLVPLDEVQRAIEDEELDYRERLYPPLVTLWIFLSQLIDDDQSCRKAVARYLAHRVSQGLPPCSANTGSYCKATQRLPEGVLRRLTLSSGQRPLRETPQAWLWLNRHVKVVDGSTVALPDTEANQKEYPQANTQKPGLGFPILRFVVMFSLAVGTALACAFGRYKGKQTGESTLFHQLHEMLEPGDVLLGDRVYSSYFELGLAQEQGADVVARAHQCRKVDFRSGVRLGQDDHLVVWHKPERPDWMAEDDYEDFPATLLVREVRVRVAVPGFRVKSYVLVTTLLNPAEVSVRDLAELYRRRWQAELNLRSLKVTLKMDVLRGQSPEQCQKELWGHLLVYNLIRGVMAEAANRVGVPPWELSFQGARQTIIEFAPVLRQAKAAEAEALCERLLAAVGQHRVGQRPNRVEPRATKRRPKGHRLTVPRKVARERLQKRRCA